MPLSENASKITEPLFCRQHANTYCNSVRFLDFRHCREYTFIIKEIATQRSAGLSQPQEQLAFMANSDSICEGELI